MGLHLFGSTSAGRCESGTPAPGDPDPTRWRILSVEHLGNYVLAEIQYDGATNYGGRKLALYRCIPADLVLADRLDPHFADIPGPRVPVARFEPTERGRVAARAAAVALEAWQREHAA